jgi:hypothetical protein
LCEIESSVRTPSTRSGQGQFAANARYVSFRCRSLKRPTLFRFLLAAGSGKPIVNTSGTMLLAHSVRGRAGTEDDEGQEGGNPRVASEKLSLAFAKRGVRTATMRLAPTVHS